ncbi:MAG: hypothetical protein Q8L51_00505 [Candidatus Amesbacteria bacterium]|nr:hypothetical protein [Candidatus Amesbacteria bacterium]
MQLYLGVLIFSFIVTALLIVPFIDFLYRMKLVRKEEKKEVRKLATPELAIIRAKHDLKAGTPTGLGILLVLVIAGLFIILFPTLLLPKVGASLVSNFPMTRELVVIFVTFVGFALLGTYDDIMKVFGFAKNGFFGLRRWHKFAIQWAIALICGGMLYWGLNIHFIYLPFIGIWDLGIGYLFLAAFLIVTFANAFDITSGLDGLGEGLLMICLSAFWVISMSQLDQVLSLFIAIWIGSLLAGIYFTIYPARAFLGNASGMAFGATLAIVGLLSGKFVPMLIVGGVFLLDGGSSLLQILSKNIFKRRIFPIAPLHHWLELVGWEEPKIVARAWLTGLVLAIFGVWLALL